jgi:hypothetical protein
MSSADRTSRPAIAALGACLLVFIFVGCSSRARQNQVLTNPLDFTFVNNSGLVIKSIYVSPQDADDWQENILTGESIRSRDRVVVRFDPQEQRSLWDLKVVASDGMSAEFENLDLRRTSRLTFRLRHGVAIAEAE